MEKDKRDKFEQLLMGRLGEFREEPSEGLFDRIEATLLDVQVAPQVEVAAPQVATKIPLWRRPAVRWALSAVAAAVVLFGVVLFVGRNNGAPQEVLLAESVEATIQTTPIMELVAQEATVEDIVANVPAPKVDVKRVATVSEDTLVAVATVEAEESSPATEQRTEVRGSKKRTSSNKATRANHPRKSDEEIEAYWRAILGLDEEPRRLGLAHPTEVSLYAANVGFNQGNMILHNITSGSMVVNEHSLPYGDAGLSGSNVFKAPQRNNQLKHYMPVSVGLTASYALADWVALETGLVYTHLYSRSDNEGQMSSYVCKRDMHYLGIPLGASFRFAGKDRWGLYGKLGATFEHCVSAKDTFFINSKKDVVADLDTSGLQLSLDAAAGVNYMLWGGVGLYGEAGVSYWQSLVPHPDNYRTENPLSLTCRIGVRFTFR
ncbi:MAG: porin family protein [Tidjanibacter sp.]|nr:porin family protein [Tidjanibacter sp.]